MTEPGVPTKWRPTLLMIVIAMLVAILSVPVAILWWFRLHDGASGALSVAELVAIGLTLVVAVIVAIVFTRTITGPIQALVQRAEAIGRGGRAAIVAPGQLGTREVAALGASLLTLARRLVDRTEYVSGFASHVSHELKSPLTAIRGAAELLRDEPMSPAEQRRFLDQIVADTDRLAALLQRLRELARLELAASPGSSRIAAVIDAASDVVIAGDGRLEIAVSPDAARAIFGQLVANSREAGAKRVTITVAGEAGMALIIVSDDGAGISPGNRDRIFDPFFTTKRERGGTGMGLQIVSSLVTAHGGTISLLPTTTGASFRVTLPL